MKSKTIIMSANENDYKGARGILTLYNEDELLKCRIRLYGITKLDRFCKLGIYHNQQVYSANLLEKGGVYTSSFVGDFDIDKDFYTAIVNTNSNNQVIISGGTYAGYYFNEDAKFNNADFSNIEMEDNPTYFEEEKNKFFNYQENDIKEETITNCNNQTNTCNCENCIYKQQFYENKNNEMINLKQNVETNVIETETIEEQNKNEENIKKAETLMQSIIPQFKYVFENYPADEELNNLLKNSKFVKINEESEQYSIGAIYENETIKYLCYAVKSNYNSPAPQEIGEHHQWLPLDKEDPLSDGYYIVFQDATDLKILEL